MTDPIIDPDLVEDLDDETLLLSIDAAADDDRPAFLAEASKRGLVV
ncbi:hypothetical protein [Sphingomonas rubra]|nr:hypothetical protein [Sphingomonas rubra]